MLAKCVLANPLRGGHSHWCNTLKLVQSQIQKWKEGRLIELWDDVRANIKGLVACRARVRSNLTSAKHHHHCNTRCARQGVADGQYKKTFQSLTSMGLVLPTADVFNDMLANHPPADPPAVPETPSPLPVTVYAEQVAGALHSFPTSSAPGQSSLRANHLKEAVFCPSPSCTNQSLLWLTKLVNLLCAGNVHQGVVLYLCGASLLPCKKRWGSMPNHGWAGSLLFFCDLIDCCVGCYWKNLFAGFVCFSDDIVLLAPCPFALRTMLNICCKYASDYGLEFNTVKPALATTCIKRPPA